VLRIVAILLSTITFILASTDTEAPGLVSLGISPTEVDVSNASASITVTARITDNMSGNAGGNYSSSPSQIRFRSPSGNQSATAILAYNLVSGTSTDGQYSYEINFPQFSESGIWTVDYVLLVDQVGNMKTEYAADLSVRSLPTSLTIFYPQINQASIVGVNNFFFSWKGFAGKAVNVERSTSLNGPWTVVSPNNDTGNYTDTDPQAAKRFYRAVLP
jgi:hypothetical protein